MRMRHIVTCGLFGSTNYCHRVTTQLQLINIITIIIIIIIFFPHYLINEELNDSYSSPNIVGDKIEKNEIGWACGAYRWREGGV